MDNSLININETLNKAKQAIREDKTLSPQMRSLMELLTLVIGILLSKIGVNSSNSSKPPSQDPLRKRGSTRKKTGRKPGGQPGHSGKTLERVKNPDRVESIRMDRRRLPRGQYKHVGYERRQVIDIRISREVTEYRAEIVENGQGKRYTAPFPEGVDRAVQYGGNIKAQAVYMSQQQLIPYERINDYFVDQCGIPISAGSLFNFNVEAWKRLESFEEIARRRLALSEVLHADETGTNINGKLHWLHSASNELWTHFSIHQRRGFEGVKAAGVLPGFAGVLVHDHWMPYFQLSCEHALCNAHHLRELERAWEQDGQRWAKRMQELLEEINESVKKAGGRLEENEVKRYRRRYRTVLSWGARECPLPPTKSRGRPKKSRARNLLDRLRNRESATLRFMTDSRVPFSNNLGERDIRMTKVQQKISGCFRSIEGARNFCRIRSYLSTCKKHKVQPTEALTLLFKGKLPAFVIDTS